MDAPIVAVIRHYHPSWEPPEDRGGWVPCLCPAHAEDNPSCAVNYELGAVKCQACDLKGNVVTLVARKEGINYRAAKRHAETILGSGYEPVQTGSRRKPRRRVFEG